MPRDFYGIHQEADGDWIQGTLYEFELLKVIEMPEHLFHIEKKFQRRGQGANKEVLVHWKGWPKKYNNWIPGPTKNIIHDSDFYVMLPSNASTNFFLN